MSGLRTIYFPKFDNKEDTITLKFVFSTPIIFEKKQTNIVKDIYHTFSPFHLIEHTLIHQNESSFNELDQKIQRNSYKCIHITKYNIFYFKY